MRTRFELALRDLRAGDPVAATRRCRVLATLEPANAQVLNLLGVASHQGGGSGEGAEALRRAIRMDPSLIEASVNLGVVARAAGRGALAAAATRHALSLDPGRMEVVASVALRTQEEGDHAGGVRFARRAARLAPSALNLFNLAMSHTADGRPDRTAAVFRVCLMVEPSGVGSWTQRGAAALSLGDLAMAEAALTRASRLDPANWDARTGLARLARYRSASALSSRGRPSTEPSPGAAEASTGLIIRGPAQGISGYAHMTNRFVATLTGRGAAPHLLGLFGDEPWASPVETTPRAGLALHALIPPAVEPIPGLATITFSMFEGTLIPRHWLPHSERHDLVIVPSRSSWEAWAGRGYPEERLRICPLGVDPDDAVAGPVLGMRTADGRSVMDFPNRILNVSDFIPRKNLDGLLRVWLRHTRADDGAVLILKPGKGAGARAGFLDLLRRAEAVTGCGLGGAAPIVVVDQTLDDAGMGALFRLATHYWSMSHGEGWDLPMSRVGVMGGRLIAPDHSAYRAYLDPSVARMIPATVGPAHLPFSREPWPVFHGLDWWEPDEAAAGEIIGRIVRGEDGDAPSARDRLLREFSWERATDRLLAILAEVGG